MLPQINHRMPSSKAHEAPRRSHESREAEHSLTVRLTYNPDRYMSWDMFRVAGEDFYQGYFTGDDPEDTENYGKATISLPEGRYVVFCEYTILNENIMLGTEGWAWIVKEIDLTSDMEIDLDADEAKNRLVCNSVTPEGETPTLTTYHYSEDWTEDDPPEVIEGNVSQMFISSTVSSTWAGWIYGRSSLGDFRITDDRGVKEFDLTRMTDIRINDISEDICLHQYSLMSAKDGFYVTSMRPVFGLTGDRESEYEKSYSAPFVQKFHPSLKAADNNPELFIPTWWMHSQEIFPNDNSFNGDDLQSPAGEIWTAGIDNFPEWMKIRLFQSYADWGVEEVDPETGETGIRCYPSASQPFGFDESGNPVKEYVQLIPDYTRSEDWEEYCPWEGNPAFSHTLHDSDLEPMATQPSLIADSREDYDWDDEKTYWYLDCLPIGRLGEWQLGNQPSVETSERDLDDGVEFTATLSGLDIEGIEGRTHMTLHLNPEKDINAPVLQLVQFRDTEGMVTDRFKKAADGVIRLAAADFNEVMKPEDGYNWWFETTQADITVEYSPLHKESWTELAVDERPEWATRELGYVYEASLKDVVSPEYSGWYDLRVTMADDDGSFSQQVISPAFKIGPQTDSIDLVTAGSPFSIIGTEALAAETALIEAYDINGRLAASSHGRLDLSALVPGLYVLRSGSRTLKYIRP